MRTQEKGKRRKRIKNQEWHKTKREIKEKLIESGKKMKPKIRRKNAYRRIGPGGPGTPRAWTKHLETKQLEASQKWQSRQAKSRQKSPKQPTQNANSKSERRKRMIQLVGGEKKYKQLIKSVLRGGRKKAKKKSGKQTVSKKTTTDKLYAEAKRLARARERQEERREKRQRGTPSAVHGRGPKRGQIPGREEKTPKKAKKKKK